MDLKRFSVFFNGQICGVFDTIQEARKYIDDRWGFYMATIWDNQRRCYIMTEVTI